MYTTNIYIYFQADKLVQTKFATHKPMMELLSKSPSELETSLPSGNGGNVENSSSVATLRALMEEVSMQQNYIFFSIILVFQVETIKAERDAIESELKSATTDMKDKFLLSLAKEGDINEPALSYQVLGQTYGPLQKQVAESLEKQKSLINRIRVSFSTLHSSE